MRNQKPLNPKAEVMKRSELLAKYIAKILFGQNNQKFKNKYLKKLERSWARQKGRQVHSEKEFQREDTVIICLNSYIFYLYFISFLSIFFDFISPFLLFLFIFLDDNINIYAYSMFTSQLIYKHQSRVIYYQHRLCTISIDRIAINWGSLSSSLVISTNHL